MSTTCMSAALVDLSLNAIKRLIKCVVLISPTELMRSEWSVLNKVNYSKCVHVHAVSPQSCSLLHYI